MNFNLLKADEDILENFYDIPELKERCFKTPLVDLNLSTVYTKNIEAIVGREELFSILFLSKKGDLKDYNIISVTEPFQKTISDSFEVDCNALLQLEFTDIRKKLTTEQLEDKKDTISLITTEQILEIINFILTNKDKKFIINCDVGISRSPAIGILLETILDNNEGINAINDHHRYSPNKILLEKFDTILK